MTWLTQSFIAMASFALMVIMVTNELKKGMSSQMAMLLIALTWIPAFGIWQWKKGFMPISASSVLVIIIAGLLSVLGNWAQFEAAARAPSPGLSASVVSCQVVLIAILAKLLFHSYINPMQIIGMLICLIGVVIISFA